MLSLLFDLIKFLVKLVIKFYLYIGIPLSCLMFIFGDNQDFPYVAFHKPMGFIVLMLYIFIMAKRGIKKPTGDMEQAYQYIAEDPENHGFSEEDLERGNVAYRVNSAMRFKIMHYASYGIGWGALMILIIAVVNN